MDFSACLSPPIAAVEKDAAIKQNAADFRSLSLCHNVPLSFHIFHVADGNMMVHATFIHGTLVGVMQPCSLMHDFGIAAVLRIILSGSQRMSSCCYIEAFQYLDEQEK